MILTLQEAKKAKVLCYSYSNGDYEYRDSTGLHLIRENIDLLDGKNATYCYSSNNGDYEYEDSTGLHLITHNK